MCLAAISLCIIRFVVIVAVAVVVVSFLLLIFDSSLCSFVLMAARAHVHPHNNCPRKKKLQRHTHQAADHVSAKKNNQMIQLFKEQESKSERQTKRKFQREKKEDVHNNHLKTGKQTKSKN